MNTPTGKRRCLLSVMVAMDRRVVVADGSRCNPDELHDGASGVGLGEEGSVELSSLGFLPLQDGLRANCAFSNRGHPLSFKPKTWKE